MFIKQLIDKLYKKWKWRSGNAMIITEQYVPQKGKILDIGCGAGFFAEYLYKKAIARKVFGIDSDPDKIRQAKLYENENLKFEVMDLRDIENGKFDCIILFDIIHHIPKNIQKELLIKIKNMLTENGILIIKDADKIPAWKYWLVYFIDKMNYYIGFTKESECCYLSKKEFEELLTSIGYKYEFPMVKFSDIAPHLLIICRK